MIYPIILAGCSGTRLGLASPRMFPVQFAEQIGGESLFQSAVKSVIAAGFSEPTIITGEDCRFVAHKQLQDIQVSAASLVVEPTPRNTAAAVLTAALLHKDIPDAQLLALPSDHQITDERAFHHVVDMARRIVGKGMIASFGVQPTDPATGLRYLKVAGGNHDVLMVSQFCENPDEQTAATMLKEGSWLWSSGMYMFRVDTILDAYDNFAPDLFGPVATALERSQRDQNFVRLDKYAFARCPSASFEVAIMENVQNCAALPLNCGWSDLSIRQTLQPVPSADQDQNIPNGDTPETDIEQTRLRSNSPALKLVRPELEDIFAVDSDLSIQNTGKSRIAVFNQVVAFADQTGLLAHGFRRFFHAWGYHEILALGPRFQVNRIMVEPGKKLSLRGHVHRAEHWVVVRGSALVTVGSEEKLLTENQSMFVPLGSEHCLANPGQLPLHLIELQSGGNLADHAVILDADSSQQT